MKGTYGHCVNSGDDSILLSRGRIRTMEEVDKQLDEICKPTFFERIKNFITKKDRAQADLDYSNPIDYDRYRLVTEKYPNGFTFEEMQEIDFNKFGTLLKQYGLLPPSYDRNPSVVNIYRGRKDGSSRVKLTFNSKTTDSYRVIGIDKYNVSFGVNSHYLYEHSDELSEAWVRFADNVRFSMEQKALRQARQAQYDAWRHSRILATQSIGNCDELSDTYEEKEI